MTETQLFVHSKASRRYDRNEIKGLEDAMGGWHTNEDAVSAIIEDYFGAIFSSSNPSAEVIEHVTQFVEPIIDADMNAALMTEFTGVDVQRALF